MPHLTRLLLVRTRAQAWRLVGVFTLVVAAAAAVAAGLVAGLLDQSVPLEAVVGFAVAAMVAPILIGPVACAALAIGQRDMEFDRLARTDPMTGALNRRGFFARAEAMFALASPEAPVCAAVIDLDEFKALNDAFGHAAGDAAIVAVAQAVSSTVEGWGGVVGRLGGDKFCAIVPAMPDLRAMLLVERLRGALAPLMIPHQGQIIRASASVAAAAQTPQDGSLDALLARADAALCRMKTSRRAAHRPGAPPALAIAGA